MDDGLLHTILVRAVSRPTFLRLVGAYSRGDGWRYPGIVRCSTAREITIESREGDIVTCLDGESVRGSRVDISLSERRASSALPGATPTPRRCPVRRLQGCTDPFFRKEPPPARAGGGSLCFG